MNVADPAIVVTIESASANERPDPRLAVVIRRGLAVTGAPFTSVFAAGLGNRTRYRTGKAAGG